jgi:hypothetical protein
MDGPRANQIPTLPTKVKRVPTMPGVYGGLLCGIIGLGVWAPFALCRG